jgi:hypothetical protein
MANELPYFRFTVQAWQNGKIAIEDYPLKGLFIDVCGYYWVQDCSIDLAMLEKKFKDAKDMLKTLISLDIIKVDKDNAISIYFLDEQFDLLSEKRIKRSKAGSKGGKQKASNARAKAKQNPGYKDKDKDKDKDKIIVAKKKSFYDLLIPYTEKYDKEMLRTFYNYWSESDSKGKLRWEKEKTYEISNRLTYWHTRSLNKEEKGFGQKEEKNIPKRQSITIEDAANIE